MPRIYPENVIIDRTAIRRGADYQDPKLHDVRSRLMIRQCSSIKYRRDDGTEITLKSRHDDVPDENFVFLSGDDFYDCLQEEKFQG